MKLNEDHCRLSIFGKNSKRAALSIRSEVIKESENYILLVLH